MTIKEIAEKFHLSVATVSKALNGSGDVSDETRKNVCAYAESVGYQSRKSKTIHGRIALLWGKDTEGHYAEIADAFREAAQEARYIVVSDDASAIDFDPNEYLVYNHFYGAFLLDNNYRSPVLAKLKDARYPLVLIDHYLAENSLVSCVGIDHVHTAEHGVNMLVAYGHRDIAFLGSHRDTLAGAEQFAGYTLGLERNGLPFHHSVIRFGEPTEEAGEEAAVALMKSGTPFTAVICVSHAMANGLIRKLNELGKRVPEDVSVLGCDFALPRRENAFLTALEPDYRAIGKCAFRSLESCMHGYPAHRAEIGCALVTRDSVKEPKR